MLSMANRLAFMVPAVFALVFITTCLSPGVSRAAECGQGTVYDAPSDSCVVLAQAPQPLAPPPPPPAAPPPPPPYNGPRPHVWVSVCAPIPFVSVCAGI